ncbi:MAG: sugar transferase [Verrucomicrobiales bacterium]|nr:sugar transferase [Verrucomicrobiales bacterium]
MLGRRQEINLKLTETVDSAILAFFLWFGHFLRADFAPYWKSDLPAVPPFSEFLWLLAIVVPFTPTILEARGFYSNTLHKSPGRSLRQMGESAVILGTIIGAITIFVRWEVPSRAVLLLGLSLGMGAILLRESWQRQLLLRRLSKGYHREKVIAAGKLDDIDTVLARMNPAMRTELQVVERIDISVCPISDLVDALHRHSVGRVLFAAQHVHFARIEEAVQACETEGVEAWISADFFQTAIARPTFDTLAGRLMLVFHSTPQASWSLFFKDVLDRTGAAILLILTLPIWLFAIIGIRLASRGPIFFRQERAGIYGKPFTMWKFRTMRPNAEFERDSLLAENEMDGPVFKITKDPRVFAFGSLLRRLSIDELPQLINVLRGEMSLVGPRPLPVLEIQRIEKRAQRRRLSVKPGLTCLWQVSGRNGITNFDEWVALDLAYIDNWSLWLDLKILLRTLPAVVRGAGAH